MPLSLRNVIRKTDSVESLQRVIDRYGGDEHDPEARKKVAVALVRLGIALVKIDRYEGAVDAYQRAVTYYGEDPTPEARVAVAAALYGRSALLSELGDSAEAARLCQRLVARHVDDVDGTRSIGAAAMLHQAVASGELGEPAIAAQACIAILRHYSFGSCAEISRLIEAVIDTHWLLFGTPDLTADVVAISQRVVDRFSDDPRAPARELVAAALYAQGFSFRGDSRADAAVVPYQKIVECYGDDPDWHVRAWASAALCSHGRALDESRQPAAARAKYRETVTRYGSDTSSDVQSWAATAQAALDRDASVGMPIRELIRLPTAAVVRRRLAQKGLSALILLSFTGAAIALAFVSWIGLTAVLGWVLIGSLAVSTVAVLLMPTIR